MRIITIVLFVLALTGCEERDITDRFVELKSPVYYRLVQYDYDGQSETFHTVRVEPHIDTYEPRGRVNAPPTLPVGFCGTYPLFCRGYVQGENLADLCDQYPGSCDDLCTQDPVNFPEACSILPITLTDFTAQYNPITYVVEIRYETATETNSSHVDIEGSLGDGEWVVIHTVPSTGPGRYDYNDNLHWMLKLN